jgi:hypothetical protein
MRRDRPCRFTGGARPIDQSAAVDDSPSADRVGHTTIACSHFDNHRHRAIGIGRAEHHGHNSIDVAGFTGMKQRFRLVDATEADELNAAGEQDCEATKQRQADETTGGHDARSYDPAHRWVQSSAAGREVEGQYWEMGLKDFRNRISASSRELHSKSLHSRYASRVDVTISDAPLRVPVVLQGEVKRQKVVPRAGSPVIELTISDGTGDIAVIFTGRRAIGGLSHGRGVRLEGVAHLENGRTVMLNPAYTLLPPDAH